MKDNLKIISFNKGALVSYYNENPDDLYAPTHIFPNIDPHPDIHYQEYKQWRDEDVLYKSHWRQPYSLAQLENQSHIHFEDNNAKSRFIKMLDKDLEIEYIESSDGVRNFHNVIKQAKADYNNVIVIFHRLHSYIVPYHMWKIAHDEDITMCIDNSFEAESYSLHRLFFWLHSNFPKTDFVKYLYAAHDIPFMTPNKMSRKNLIKKEFGIDLVNIEFFLLHELQGNKTYSDNDERSKLIFKNFEPDIFYNNKKPKKFLCLNNYMKDHRIWFINYLNENNLLDYGIVSARFSLDSSKPFYNHGVQKFGSYSSLNNVFTNTFNDHSFDMEKYNSLNEVLPLIVDDDLIDNKHAINPDMFSDHINNNNYEFRDRWVNWEWYANTKFTIVPESSFTPDLISQPGIFRQYIPDHNDNIYYDKAPNDIGFLTEKTFKPIMYGHPFILITHPGALDRLHQLGFETFPEWFDENYDSISDHGDRIKFIGNQVKKACENDLDINPIKDKLEWNRHHFFSIDNALTIFNNLFEDLLKRDK